MKVIAVTNRKGGVAKTTTTVNLAHGLIQLGKSVLVIDMDPQADLTLYLINNEERVVTLDEEHRTGYYAFRDKGVPIGDLIIDGSPSLLPSGDSLWELEDDLSKKWDSVQRVRERIGPLRQQYDYILFDCPPSYGLLTINALTAADAVLIPVKTDLMSIRGLPRAIRTMQEVQRGPNPTLQLFGILPTVYAGQQTHDQKALRALQTIAEEFDVNVISPIHQSTFYKKSVEGGRSTLEAFPRTRGVDTYHKLAQQVISHE